MLWGDILEWYRQGNFMSFLSPVHHDVNTEICRKQTHAKKEKHLSTRMEQQPLDKQGWGQDLCFVCLFHPVGCDISRNVDKISEAFCFHRYWTLAQPLTFSPFRKFFFLSHLFRCKHCQYSHLCRWGEGRSDKWVAQLQNTEVYQPCAL